jgi:ATP-citrate lyase beta-subunit
MAQRGIREYDGKKMLAKHWQEYVSKTYSYPGKVVLVNPTTKIDKLPKKYAWLHKEKLVVKPDQLFGKRGKHGLIKTNASFEQVQKWIKQKMNTEVTIGKVTGKLTHFLIEPYVDHQQEYYIAIKTNRQGDTIYFSNHGGVDIESVWDTVSEISVEVNENINQLKIEHQLPKDTPPEMKKLFTEFIKGLYRFYKELRYAYLEINPFAVSNNTIIPLDLVARLDDTAHFEVGHKWGDISFPAPFGRQLIKEEQYIKELDEKSGASLKLTILNPKGRVWTMVAGGGASVIYTDTIVDLGLRDELANYGEYSGNPTTEETYVYAKTILDLITRKKDPKNQSKFLLIGGGIANFTDVAKTFTGITMALRDYKKKLIDNKVKIFVRRGGPNYQEGLRIMENLGKEIGVPITVYGPETHMTRIVNMAQKEKGGR